MLPGVPHPVNKKKAGVFILQTNHSTRTEFTAFTQQQHFKDDVRLDRMSSWTEDFPAMEKKVY